MAGSTTGWKGSVSGNPTECWKRRATPLGLEPRMTEPKSVVLPLHHGAVGFDSVLRQCLSTARIIPSAIGKDNAVYQKEEGRFSIFDSRSKILGPGPGGCFPVRPRSVANQNRESSFYPSIHYIPHSLYDLLTLDDSNCPTCVFFLCHAYWPDDVKVASGSSFPAYPF